MDQVQAHIVYSGTVQGVGFRYTVQSYARKFNCTGWVKNLADGNVKMVVEAPQEAIDELCESIEDHFKGYIQNKEITINASDDNFGDFQIIF